MEPTDKTTNTVSGNGQAARTKQRAQATAQRAQTTAHDTVDRAARGVHDTVDRLADTADRAASSFGEKGEQFSETKERMMAQTRTYVQTHPVASIGIAVAAGFLLSRLLHSDSH